MNRSVSIFGTLAAILTLSAAAFSAEPTPVTACFSFDGHPGGHRGVKQLLRDLEDQRR
jgi:hypothetical protein